MNGQFRAESEVGRGSKFTFAFAFPLPTPAETAAFLEATKSTPQQDTNSLTYTVPQSSVHDPPSTVRRHSNDSIRSCGSTGSARSEIDQLVKMIASPSMEEPLQRPSGSRQTKRRNSPREERNPADRGEYLVQDSGTSIRSVKVGEDDVDVPAARQIPVSGRAVKPGASPILEYKPEHLHVLVAEDDPVNRAIVKKRLEMDGHSVTLTQNGLEVVDTFVNIWKQCDIILMDLQALQKLPGYANL